MTIRLRIRLDGDIQKGDHACPFRLQSYRAKILRTCYFGSSETLVFGGVKTIFCPTIFGRIPAACPLRTDSVMVTEKR